MKNNKISLSIVSPVYQAESILDELLKKIKENVLPITDIFEIILIDDGSSDSSWIKIIEHCKKDNRIKGIKLSRNFGQHYAITAGLRESKNDFTIVMDCDLQDNPKYIPLMIEEIKKGYDIVYAVKKIRRHSFFKNLLASSYYKIFNFLSDNKEFFQDSKVGSFTILSKKVVNAYCEYKDFHRPYLLLLNYLGFKSSKVLVNHANRYSGGSSYKLTASIKLALDSIISSSTRLLYISIYIGFIFCALGSLFILYVIYKYFTSGFLLGWPSLMVSIIFCSGLVLINLGIVGLYISRTFIQTKNRPLYFIDKKLN